MMKWWGWGDPNKSFNVDNRPDFWNFVKKITGQSDFYATMPPSLEEIRIPEPRIHAECLEELQKHFKSSQIATDKESRLSHCYGKSFRDLLRIYQNNITSAPDIILYPNTHDDVATIMRIATKYPVTVIPFGGGTNIVGGVEVLPNQSKMVITVNMQRMNQVISIDKDSMLAVIQAGVLGKHLEEQLNKAGYTFGHFPDSFEYSSLGGWVVTRSAGMQSDYYGNIENRLVAVTFVSPQGEIRTQDIPRAAMGPDINEIVLGSEGILGILTEVTVRIDKLSPKKTFAFLFPSFENAVHTLRSAYEQDCRPTMMRISDPAETALSTALSPKVSLWESILKKIFFVYLFKVKKFNKDNACISMVSFKAQDKDKIRRFVKLAKHFGAINLGNGPAQKWSDAKYDYPYIRDFLLHHGIIVDVSETSIKWGALQPFYAAIIQSMQSFYNEKFSGKGYIGCHLSHSYHTGACLYFTFACYARDKNMLEMYKQAKHHIMEAIMLHGGALSHHHAIGIEHLPWMHKQLDNTSLDLLQGIKATLDPQNLCNPGKLIPDKRVIEQFW